MLDRSISIGEAAAAGVDFDSARRPAFDRSLFGDGMGWEGSMRASVRNAINRISRPSRNKTQTPNTSGRVPELLWLGNIIRDRWALAKFVHHHHRPDNARNLFCCLWDWIDRFD